MISVKFHNKEICEITYNFVIIVIKCVTYVTQCDIL